MKKILFSLFLTLCSWSALAYYLEEVNGIVWKYYVVNGEAIIGDDRIYANGYAAGSALDDNEYCPYSITVPSSLGGYPVVEIGVDAFDWCPIYSISIPNGVRQISEGAFAGTDLPYISLPDSLTSIKTDAFSFSNLQTISIPKNVNLIEEGAFHECSVLTSISVAPDNPSYFSSNGVLYKKNPQVLVCVPDNYSSTMLKVLDGTTRIGSYACGYESVLEYVDLPGSVVCIGEYAFGAFLKDIILSDSLERIEEGAFIVADLSFAVIPPSVTYIGESVFLYCNRLKDIWIHRDSKLSTSRLKAGNKATIKRYPICKSEKKNGIEWNYYLDDGVAVLGSNLDEDKIWTFTNAVHASTSGTLMIPSSLGGKPVREIGDFAFFAVSNLTTVIIPNSVRELGDYCFDECVGLEYITIPNSVKEIDLRAFAFCDSLTNITLGTGLVEIDDQAFYGCTNLTFVALPKSVTTIGDGIFGECDTLQEIWIHESSRLSVSQLKMGNSAVVKRYKDPLKSEPGLGSVPYGGASKYDVTVSYDGSSHGINEAALNAVRVDGVAPQISYSLSQTGAYQSEPFQYMQAGKYVVWYKLTFVDRPAYVHKAQLTIKPKALTSSMVSVSGDLVYSGTAQTPVVSVSDPFLRLLTKDDYSVKFSNNVNAGTATATLTGKRNYSGTISKTFVIKGKPMTVGEDEPGG